MESLTVNDKFVEKRHINHPRSTVLLQNVSKRKLQKLQGWVSSHDQILICPCHSSRELFLINETRRPRDPPADPAEIERIRVVMERYHAERKGQSQYIPDKTLRRV